MDWEPSPTASQVEKGSTPLETNKIQRQHLTTSQATPQDVPKPASDAVMDFKPSRRIPARARKFFKLVPRTHVSNGVQQHRFMIELDGEFHCICGYKTDTKRRLSAHFSNKKRVKPQPRIPCHICGKLLASRSSLRTHVDGQHSGTFYQCTICNALLKSEKYFVTHM